MNEDILQKLSEIIEYIQFLRKVNSNEPVLTSLYVLQKKVEDVNEKVKKYGSNNR